MSRGVMAEPEVLSVLTALGMDRSKVRLAILREKLGLIPRTRLQLPTPAVEFALAEPEVA